MYHLCRTKAAKPSTVASSSSFFTGTFACSLFDQSSIYRFQSTFYKFNVLDHKHIEFNIIWSLPPELTAHEEGNCLFSVLVRAVYCNGSNVVVQDRSRKNDRSNIISDRSVHKDSVPMGQNVAPLAKGKQLEPILFWSHSLRRI